ncbi:MAG: hypothetical protein HY912_12380 [Desulfomonile tiedjei]|uniref:Uncharacterized protein n=1 Tax=Desulfomonile tiedjei TaxID=2358 RepID=A0A9D6V1T3_9BACT|nr:hypothetical protein [Desulfomonile tiedjei]
MGGYKFEQYCRPRGDYRIRQIIDFLDLMKDAFRCSVLYDDHSRPVDLTEQGLGKIFKKIAERKSPGPGIIEHFFTIDPRKRHPNTVRIEIITGHHPEKVFMDTYNISMDDKRKVPNLDYLEKSIEIFKPFEAYLSENENEFRLDAYGRQQYVPKFDKPTMIRGFHYLDENMARSIGGIKYCLKAPAWNVERFCEGVLIELTPRLFDSNDPEHLEIQKEVMDYFHL